MPGGSHGHWSPDSKRHSPPLSSPLLSSPYLCPPLRSGYCYRFFVTEPQITPRRLEWLKIVAIQNARRLFPREHLLYLDSDAWVQTDVALDAVLDVAAMAEAGQFLSLSFNDGWCRNPPEFPKADICRPYAPFNRTEVHLEQVERFYEARGP